MGWNLERKRGRSLQAATLVHGPRFTRTVHGPLDACLSLPRGALAPSISPWLLAGAVGRERWWWVADGAAALDRPASRVVERTLRAGRLTGRGLGGVRRVARTVADLAGHDGALGVDHVSAALALRAEPTFLDGRAA